jgi:cyclopropane fatty-acyl-phospholipid synthase-like methyltransferase
MDKNIKYVQNGYDLVAKNYRKQKDSSYAQLPIFLKWLKHPQNTTKILELGCASGYPIGKAILEQKHDYLGIDLSEEQIYLAKTEFPQWSNCFQLEEMLSFCKSEPSEHYSGIISFFTIRHLPRIYHVELFTNVFRLLKSAGLFLLDFSLYSDEGRDTWFDDSPMYWSSFSQEWMFLTLKEIGFKLLDKYEETKIFNGQEERTLFLLYQKPTKEDLI